MSYSFMKTSSPSLQMKNVSKNFVLTFKTKWPPQSHVLKLKVLQLSSSDFHKMYMARNHCLRVSLAFFENKRAAMSYL